MLVHQNVHHQCGGVYYVMEKVDPSDVTLSMHVKTFGTSSGNVKGLH